MVSVANLVRLYLRNKPYLLEALEKDVANLSKLSRIIQKELGINKLTAIKASVRRYAEEIRKLKKRREERVMKILKESKITILDNISVAITDEKLQIPNKAEVKLNSYYVYIIEMGLLEEVKRKFKHHLLRWHENCVAIIITSPEDIEKVPGVVAFITSLLAAENINVIEFVSCFTQTILVLDRADVLRSYEILLKVIGS